VALRVVRHVQSVEARPRTGACDSDLPVTPGTRSKSRA
jgi:hypothetical protein